MNNDTRLNIGIILICSLLYTPFHAADIVPWSDICEHLFRYGGTDICKALACTCKDFYEKNRQLYMQQNKLICTMPSRCFLSHMLRNGDDRSFWIGILGEPSKVIIRVYTPSILFNNIGKEWIGLVMQKSIFEGQCVYASKLAYVSGFVANNGNEIDLETNSNIIECSAGNYVYSDSAYSSPGYRDPNGKFFLFLAPNPETYLNTYLMCFSRKTNTLGAGQFERLGKINLHHKPQVASINAHDGLVTFNLVNFQNKSASIDVDLKTKKIIRQHNN